MPELDIVAILTPNKGKEDRLEELIEGIAGHVTNSEKKVIRYKPYRLENNDGSVEFVVIERYPDESEFQAHTSTNAFAELGKVLQAENVLAKPLNIMKLKPLKGGFDNR